MKEFKTLGKYFAKYKLLLVIGIVALIIVDLGQLFIPQYIKEAVNNIIKIGAKGIIRYGIMIIIIGGVVTVFRFLWQYYIFGVALKIERHLRNSLYSHLQKLEYKLFSSYKVGDLMARATNDVEAVTFAIEFGTIIIIDVIVQGVLAFIFMWHISVKLTLYAIIPTPLIVFVTFYFGRLIHQKFKSVQDEFSNLTARVRETIEGIRIIRAYNQGENEVKKFKKVANTYLRKNVSLFKTSSLFRPILFFGANVGLGIILWKGGKDVIMNQISMGEFFAFYFYLELLIWPLIGLGWVINLLERGAASMKRINRLLQLPTESKVKKTAQKITYGEIKLENVNLSYNGRPILKNINLTIPAKSKVGIVGRIGAGKSTLVELLPLILKPTKGRIKIDEIPVENIPLDILRREVLLVPQVPFLFSGSIKFNIKFSSPEITEEKLEKVTKLALIYEKIISLPRQFDEEIGEKGVTLSGGERQRLAIARALVLKPKVLILDNALSSLDAEKETIVLQNILNELEESTVIIVSHRIWTLTGIERIIVIEKGEIVEDGGHKELMERKGRYYNLFNLEEKDDS